MSIICAALRFDKMAALAHSLFGIVMTYTFVLYFLVPFGLTADIDPAYTIDMVLGFMLLIFLFLQVAVGVASRVLQQGKMADIFRLKTIRKVHRGCGYFLAVV